MWCGQMSAAERKQTHKLYRACLAHSANEAREVHQHQYAKKMALLSLVHSPTYFALPALDAWRSTCHAHPLVWLVFCDTLQACVALTCIVVLWDHVDTSLMMPYSCADDDSFIMPPPQCVCVCPPQLRPPLPPPPTNTLCRTLTRLPFCQDGGPGRQWQ